MPEKCNHDCSNCAEKCDSQNKQEKQDFTEPFNQFSSVKKTIAVISGKGGVGKSLVTSLLASEMRRRGNEVGILDADITGPSIPKAFGITKHAVGSDYGILPEKTKTGIEVMSVNLLLENDTDPVIWRGPVLAGTVKQFYSDVFWGELDYLFIDMPPGTGDVPLTVFQSLSIDGIVIVTSPQELVSMIVGKAVKMAKMMNITIFAIVENMSYFECPDCGKRHNIFGESRTDETAIANEIPVVAKIPVDPDIPAKCDNGNAEDVKGGWLNEVADFIQNENS